MKIWHKILVPSLVAILFLLALGGISAALMARQGLAMAALVKNRGGSVTTANAVFLELGDAQAELNRSYVGAADLRKDTLKQLAEARATRLAALEKKVGEYLALTGLEPEERELVESAQPRIGSYRQHVDKAFAQLAGDPKEALGEVQAADAEFQTVTRTFSQLIELQAALTQKSQAVAAADFRRMLLAIGAIAVFAALASLLTALAMARRVVRPLHTAIASAGDIARGDLSRTIDVRGRDETADLLRAQAEMKRQLTELVGEVIRGAHAVSDTSAQIAEGNQDLSQRTEEQATTLEETASSMEELTSTVSLNAQNARQASQLAAEAAVIARRGGEAVDQVVNTMDEISDASRKISDIIGVIDGIAFQTNILALNAAVEAARAGEQGRGFAVVAAEVRNLAQRSAAAAKEIKGLIAASTDKVNTGGSLVDTAGHTMVEVVMSVKKVSDLIAEIAAASEEQDAGIQQVNTAVTQMDQVVQQNASLVEEATAAAGSMQDQARGLLRLVERFRLADDASRIAPHGDEAPAAIRVRSPEPALALQR
jgi:methyl-accepting chemotaxis protein